MNVFDKDLICPTWTVEDTVLYANSAVSTGSASMGSAVDRRELSVYSRSATGGWNAAAFIIGAEVLERFAYYGISINLISYLTGPLGESTAAAAANVNAWGGVSMILPLIGGVIGDSFGRYRAAVFSSIIYVLGLGMLALSAAESIWPQSRLRNAFFFSALYLVAAAQGGHKPCVIAFGADQFDGNDPDECRSRSSFFNWMYFGVCWGTAFTVILMSYIQDNIGWELGFGLPCISMAIASALLFSGTCRYRFSDSSISQNSSHKEENEPLLTNRPPEISRRGILRLLPIWATCLLYAVVFAQSSTLFTKQGSTVDRRLFSFVVPPAALQSFISISILASLPFYDRFFVPIARSFTGHPSGLTMLQRVGIGMFLSVTSMIVAALVETQRLQTAEDLGLVDEPDSAIPMSLLWFIPQYVIYGISDVFTVVGLQEFFYDQVPEGLRGLGLALNLSIFGIGSFLSSLMVLTIQKVSAWYGDDWFDNNLNRAHLNYFYWLLAALSFVDFLLFLYFASVYRYTGTAIRKA